MSTGRRPTYEGRPLPRPDEELVDQGLGFDLGTLLSRRQALRGFGIGAAALGLGACAGDGSSSSSSRRASSASSAPASSGASTAGSSQEIPDETAGPYPGDGSNGLNVLTESGVVRSDIRASFGDYTGTADGVPMQLELVLRDLANGGVPFAGAAVYVWHCDREGRYSLYSDGATDQNYLRGVQVADGQGRVRFTTVFPACYPGRWPHVHFEVYADPATMTDSAAAVATSQVALPQDVCEAVYDQKWYEGSAPRLSQVSLRSDVVFGEDSGALQLAMASGDVAGGYTVTLPVAVDTTTRPAIG